MADHSAVTVNRGELRAREGPFCLAVAFIHREDAQRLVVEMEYLRIRAVHNDGLRFLVELVIVRRSVLGHDVGVGVELGQDDLPVLVRAIQAVAGGLPFVRGDKLSGRRGDLESRSGKRQSGHAVKLLDHKRAFRDVAELKRRRFAAFYHDGLRGVVEDITGFCAGFLDDQRHAGGKVVYADRSGAVRRVVAAAAADDRARAVGYIELHVGQRRMSSRVDLLDQQLAHRGILKHKGLRIVGIHSDGLRQAVQHISVRGLFLGDDIGAGGEVEQPDLTVAPGGIEAVGRDVAAKVIRKLAVGGRNAEDRAGEGRAGDAVAFLNDQPAVGRIAELQLHDLACFDLNGLRNIVQHIPVLRARLLDDQRRFGRNPGNTDRACAVRGVVPSGSADDRARAVRHIELDAGQRRMGGGVDLLDQQPAHRGILKHKGLRIVGVYPDGLRLAVQDVTVRGLFLGHDIGAGGEVEKPDLTVSPGGIEAVRRDIAPVVVGVLAACGGDAEDRTGEGRAGDAVPFLNDQPAVGGIAVFEHDGFSRLDLNGLRGIVQHISVLRAGFLDDQRHAGVEIVNEDRSGAVGGVIAAAVPDDCAAAVRHIKLHVGQRRMSSRVDLLNQQPAHWGILK